MSTTLPDLWMLSEGSEQDVVVSTRMRLARNVAGYKFKTRFGQGEAEQLEAHLKDAVTKAEPGLRYTSMVDLDSTMRDVFFERHLVSAEHVQDGPPRGVAYSDDGTTSVMVNEEDHLRIQVFAPGLELSGLGEKMDALDDAIGGHVQYSFDSKLGYLTSCPTNTGTGLRVSVMLHLPALSFQPDGRGKRSGEQGILKVTKAAQKLGLTVRGTHGESSRAEGDFYQISNQVTLGRTPEQAVADLQTVLEHVVKYERNSRDIMLKDDRLRLEDVVWRAWGLLRHARSVTSREALAHLSALRLGAWLGLIDAVDAATLHALMVRMRPGHLQYEAGRELGPEDRDVVRARLIRDTLQTA